MYKFPPTIPDIDELFQILLDLQTISEKMLRHEAPIALKTAYVTPGFLETLSYAPADERYTRRKVAGGTNGGLVLRTMEWPSGAETPPHEHHGELCAEIVTQGMLVVTDVRKVHKHDDLYDIREYCTEGESTYILEAGDTAVVNPFTDMHVVKSPVLSRSLHVYTVDPRFGVYYEPECDLWRRMECILPND